MATRPPVESFMAPRAINQAYHLKGGILLKYKYTGLELYYTYVLCMNDIQKGAKYVQLLIMDF